MAYATVANMLKKFGETELVQLTDIEAPYQNAINLDKLQAALDEANSEIDGYLSRFPPLSQPYPPFLVNIACQMARYHACQSVSENNTISTRYSKALKSLQAIADGKISLGTSPAGENKQTQTANTVQFQVGRRDFGGRGW